MLNKKIQIDWYWIAGVIMLLALSRLIPHPPNFTPIGAMAILAGAVIKDIHLGILIPVAAMIISDILIGFHSSLVYVYGAVILMVLMSRLILGSYSVSKLVVTALLASILFFLVTNFGAWLSHDMYPRTLNGLWQAYVAGVPFFRNTLLGNLLFTAISFYIVTFIPINNAARA